MFVEYLAEHGVDATAQDMISVENEDHIAACVSLYGDDEASLHPDPETLADLDILLFDIQDIGSRYYTYQATLAISWRWQQARIRKFGYWTVPIRLWFGCRRECGRTRF